MRKDLGLNATPNPTLERAVLSVLRSNLSPEEKADKIRAILVPDEASDQAADNGNTTPAIAPGVRGMSPVVSASHSSSSGRSPFGGWPNHPVGMQKSFLDNPARLVPSACRGKRLYTFDGQIVDVDERGGVSFSRPARRQVNVPGPEETLESMRRAIGLPAR
jgi:hypothetical protein